MVGKLIPNSHSVLEVELKFLKRKKLYPKHLISNHPSVYSSKSRIAPFSDIYPIGPSRKNSKLVIKNTHNKHKNAPTVRYNRVYFLLSTNAHSHAT